MKKHLLVCLTILLFGITSVEAQKIHLPTECVKILNQKFKGWKMAKVNKEVAAWLKKSKRPYSPNLIKGDFDGDRKTDYAVLIRQGADSQAMNSTIVFLNSAKGYRMFNLEDGDGDYLVFERKGSKIFDYEKNKSFVSNTDFLSVGIWEKSQSVYVWRNGKFVRILTSD